MKTKEGVSISCLARPMNDALPKIESAYRSHKADEWAVITSANDGHHMAGSKHYQNLAVDLRIPGGLNQAGRPKDPNLVAEFVSTLRIFLGGNFDVVLEKNHIHVEYDPKIKPQKIYPKEDGNA